MRSFPRPTYRFTLVCLAVLGLMATAGGVRAEDDGFKSLFNGKDLAGWDADTTFWSVVDGAILGECTPEKQPKHNTFCIWRDGEVDDFELKAKFKIVGGNSGIQFRSKDQGDWIIAGPQADMDGGNAWTGTNYEERGRGVLAKCGERTVIGADGKITVVDKVGDHDAIVAGFKKEDWNEYDILAVGNHVVQKINGVVTCDYTDEQVEKRSFQGVLALQMHAGFPHFTVQFKDIMLKRLKLSDNRKKIVLIAGKNSHGLGEHEFEAGTWALRKCLDKVPGVIAADYYKGWPADPTAFDNADAVMIYCDGGGGHPAVQGDHLAVLDALAKKGVGLAFSHYGVEVPKDKGGPQFLDWIGGYYEGGYSANPVWEAHYDELPSHPVTRGVKPFTTRDEWYFNIRFRPEQKGVTPILTAKPSDETRKNPYSGSGPYPHIVADNGRTETMMWVVDNAGANPNAAANRGFGFTGGHYHKNWADDNQRKLMLNALLWIAKAEVPADGVESHPSEEELNSHLRSRIGKPATAAAASGAAGAIGSVNAAKAKFTSKVITAGTCDIDVDITGAKELYLVVGDAGDGFACDWADWVAPVLVGPNGETKLTDEKWKSAEVGWGKAGINSNVGGNPLKIDGKEIANGIGVHSPSVIAYDIAGKGYTRFKAKGGVDNGGTDQNGGSSVQFMVFTEKPNLTGAEAGAGAGGGQPKPAAGARPPEEALKALKAADGTEITMFANEPMMTNPTDIDVDAYGRVWVCEGVNYRRWEKNIPEGDRIVVLEDTDGDGKADKARTFYQGTDINAALGICVLGDKVIVSCSPNVFLFTDNGEGKPPTKELLFTGIAGHQHDHAVHAFVAGPDGKLYFNFGNAGERIKDKDGKPVIDVDGNEVNKDGKPYRQGMVFRCNPDGSEFEVLGNNFRNNYEVTVDSFGTLWQSDNDDDGNKGVRINYVMEHGNYGYTDEFTGAGWGSPRTNIEKDIPLRHWHQNDPGVVPNLLGTGGGSPTGICVYEGTLLPEVFRNQIIHCDAGPNVVRAYPVSADGAGYKATTAPLITATDSWFRPADVCVGPDGSVFVADWYDPGVGGHNMGDNDPKNTHGHIYRVAPPGHKLVAAKPDFSSAAGAAAALRSPNYATRWLAWQKLHALGADAEGELAKLWADANPRLRARALWLLARIKGSEAKYVDAALKDADADVRITGLRLARELKLDLIPLVKALAKDPSAQVRRDCAIALRHSASPEAAGLWAELAAQHDGKDRWYLEALGIGADKNETAYFAAWQAKVGDSWNTAAGRDIVWRSRGAGAPALLARIIADKATIGEERPRYFRSFDFLAGPEKDAALVALLNTDHPDKDAIAIEALGRLKNIDLDDPGIKATIDKMLDASKGTAQFVALVERFKIKDRNPGLIDTAAAHPRESFGVTAARLALANGGLEAISAVLTGSEVEKAAGLAGALGPTNDQQVVPVLLPIATDNKRPMALRVEAVRSLGKIQQGAKELLDLVGKNQLAGELKITAGRELQNAPWDDIRAEAVKTFPPMASKSDAALPPIAKLAAMKGDARHGAEIFALPASMCTTCHKVGDKGIDFGPNLSEIGGKLGKDAILEAIIYPDAGIAAGFETTSIKLKSGNLAVGFVVSETDAQLTLKAMGGIVTNYDKADIIKRLIQKGTPMPVGLQRNMTTQDLIDLVEYLSSLKKK